MVHLRGQGRPNQNATFQGGPNMQQPSAQYVKRSTPYLLSLILLLVLFGVVGVVQAEENLVANPDFEQGIGTRGAPLHWTIGQDSQSMRIELSDERAQVGTTSVRFVDNDPNGALALRSDPIEIEAGHRYIAQADVWVVEGKAMLYVEYRDEGNLRIATSRTTSSRTGDWETLTVESVAPDSARFATILLYSDKANVGEHFFDNARLISAQEALANQPVMDQEGYDVNADSSQLDYTPAQGDVVLSNPPSFVWVPVFGAASYTLEYSSDPEFSPETTRTVEGIDLSVYTPDHTLDVTQTWYWRVRGVDARDNTGTPSTVRSFIVHPDAVEMPLPSMEEVRSRIPAGHPRLFVTPDTLPTFNAKRTSDLLFREVLWKNIQTRANSLVYTPLSPEPPHAMPGGVRDINLWRQYSFAVEATNNAETLAFYYMLTGDELIGEKAREWMLHIASWDPRGATSAAVNDEASMPILHKLARAYSWAYDALSPEDRQVIQDVMRIRGNEAYQILKRRPYESRPYGSHAARQLGFLLEPAIAFLGEIPEAEEWFDYVVRVIFAVYPAWGGDEGGWSEGQAYFSSYVNRALWFVDVLREATGLDLFGRAFFQNNGYFKLYTHPPYAKIGPFGDHADRGPTQTDGYILRVYAVRNNNPYFQWYADQMGGGVEPGVMGFIRAVLHPPFQVQAQAPSDLPPSRYFSDIGWVAIHRSLGDRENAIQFMFRSSPYGTWSHSLADQNTFTIEAYGEPLAISSGYRPYYGSAHHMGWTKATQAHNGILVNGQGQPVQSIDARGQVIGFLNGRSFDYTAGDATAAYPRLLDRAVRHVVYLRPDVFVLFDDLVAPTPSEYSWLLHAYHSFEYDEATGSITVNARNASLQGQLWASSPTRFSQTNEFAVPLDEPMNVAEQWHLTATTTERADTGYFLSVLRPRKRNDATEFAAERFDANGGQGVRIEVDGTVGYIMFADGSGSGEAHLQNEALRSNGTVAAWSQTAGSQGLLMVGGTEWQAANGLLINASAPVDIELTVEQVDGALRVEGSLDAQQAGQGTPITIELSIPELASVGNVAADVDVTWEFTDGTLTLELTPKPGVNKFSVKR